MSNRIPNMQTLTIKDPQDAIVAARVMLGFQPENSLVVLPIGGGPAARLDLGPTQEMRAALAMARAHWNAVLVLVYTDSDAEFLRYLAVMPEILPGITLIDVMHAPNADPDAGRTRADIVAEAQAVTHPHEAEELALAAWRNGDGATAWAMHDRAAELVGAQSLRMQLLAMALECAVNPRKGQPA